jgi:phosphatidylserine/phosphatidylglycerophosphate/cardiolipin synthase-like enzyme
VIHSTVVIVDDTWCAVGSANCMRRSLYTDIELSAAILDEPTPAHLLPITWAEEQNLPVGKRAPSVVQRFRRDLWAHLCAMPLAPTRPGQQAQLNGLLALDRALGIWRPLWRVAAAGPPPPPPRRPPARPRGSSTPPPLPPRPTVGGRVGPPVLRRAIVALTLAPAQPGAGQPFQQSDYDRLDFDSRTPC